MTEIQEIPLDITEEINTIQDNPLDIAETTAENPLDIAETTAEKEPVVEETKPVKAKAKGRPKGAANKGPSKPRAKKSKVKETPVEAAEEPAYEPSSPKRNLKIPTDPSSSDIAAAMLKLLQDQSSSRQSRKQMLYNSWFQ